MKKTFLVLVAIAMLLASAYTTSPKTDKLAYEIGPSPLISQQN